MRGGPDPDNRRDFPGGWPGDPRDAFTREGRSAEEQRVFDHVRTLMRLRKATEPLRRGRHVHLAIGEQSYVYARQSLAGTAIVALNNDAKAAPLTVDVSPPGLEDGTTLTDKAGGAETVRVSGQAIEVLLPPRSGAVFVR